MNTLWLAFITGLTSGGISCLAVQGGLLTASISQAETNGTKKVPLQFVAFFLLGKTVGLGLVGLLLGIFGSVISFSLHVQGYLQVAIGIYMLLVIGQILDIHPIFRKFIIQPPTKFYRLLKQITKREGTFLTPVILGFFTILIPCGVTQLMMASAIAVASPVLSAGIMVAFAIGTSPLFFILGSVVGEFSKRKAFSYISAAVIAYFAILSVNGGLTLLGFPYTINNLYAAATTDFSKSTPGQAATIFGGKQMVTMAVSSSGYKPSTSTLKAGVPVSLTLNTSNTQGCIRVFTIPSLNVSKVLPENGTEVVEFTPKTAGTLAYSCNMGMYSGTFDVIN